jgi:hypothetical protein
MCVKFKPIPFSNFIDTKTYTQELNKVGLHKNLTKVGLLIVIKTKTYMVKCGCSDVVLVSK